MTEYMYPLTPHALVNATHAGKFEQVKRILASDVNVNDYTGNAMPALTIACCNGNVEMVKYFLEQGADPNNYTESRISALKSAAGSNSPNSYEISSLLLNAGADPNYEREGNVALTLACDRTGDVSNDVPLISSLLNVTDEKYYQKAYEYGQTEEIRELIQKAAFKKNIVLVDPVDGFGGPQYKMKLYYDTLPENADPVVKQVCEILDEYIDKFVKDPNKAMIYVFERMAIVHAEKSKGNDENQKLYLSKYVRNAVMEVLKTYPLEQVEKTYWDLYAVLTNYVSEDEHFSEDEE